MEMMFVDGAGIDAFAIALEFAHAVADGKMPHFSNGRTGDVVVVSRDRAPREITALERSLGLSLDVSWFYPWDGGLGTMTHAIERCKEISPSIVVVDGIEVADSGASPRGGDLVHCADIFRRAARVNGWSLIFCCPSPDRDEQADRVRDRLCDLGLHEIVRGDDDGLKVYDHLDRNFSPSGTRLKPSQVALEFPIFDGGPLIPLTYDLETLLQELETVYPRQFQDWDEENPDEVDWAGLHGYLEGAHAVAVAQRPV